MFTGEAWHVRVVVRKGLGAGLQLSPVGTFR